MKRNIFFLIFALLLVFFPLSAGSEFYEYVDENGVKTFTNDQGTIPPSQADDVKIHKERYDDLSEEERQRMIEAEAARLEEIERQKDQEWEKYIKKLRLRQLERENAKKKKSL